MNDYFNIVGKVVCITGASKGIGKCLSENLAQKGAHIIGVARDEVALQQLKQAVISNGYRFDYVKADLTKINDIPHIVQDIQAIAAVDVLINAAGINLRGNAEELSIEDWQKTIDINLSAPFFLTRLLVEHMKKQKWGRIINIASLQSYRAFDNGIAYGTTKGGITQLTRAMAQQWSCHGINCNAIAPGFFPTELTKVLFDNEQTINKLAEQTCIGRTGKLSDLIGPTLFLASDASQYVTGHILSVDGGFLAK